MRREFQSGMLEYVDDQRMHIGDHTQRGEALQGLGIQMVMQSIDNRQLWDAVLQTQRSSS